MSVLALMLLSLAPLLQFDDPPEARALELVNFTETQSRSPAYLYLLGIDAPRNQKPADHGERLLAYSRQQDDLVAKDPATTESAPWPEYLALPRPEGDLFCRWSETDCKVRVLSHGHSAPELSETDQVLLDRYQNFMAMDGFSTLSKPSLHEPLPSFRYLVTGQRLAMLGLLEKAHDGEPAEAIHQLSENLTRVRAHLADADTLVGKMVYLALMSENLDVLASLLAEHGYKLAPELPPMTAAERDFTLPMAREFAMSYHMFQSMDRHPRFFDTSQDASHTPGWWVRAVFKPNMTGNAVLPVYQQAIELSRVDPADFPQAMANADRVTIQPDWLRNPAGSILADVAGPRYEDYVAQAFSIHGKLSLLSQIIDLKRVPNDLETLDNPLTSRGNDVHWDDDRRHLCLAGPGEDARQFRCLLIGPDPLK